MLNVRKIMLFWCYKNVIKKCSSADIFETFWKCYDNVDTEALEDVEERLKVGGQLLLQTIKFVDDQAVVVDTERGLQRMKDNYSALLWQKEASDIPSKFELLVFSYFT